MKKIKDKFLSYSVDKEGVGLIEINQNKNFGTIRIKALDREEDINKEEVRA